MKLTLSREQRARLFASGCPRISGTGKCPVDKGYVYRLSKLVELRVLRVSVRRDTSGESWWLHYEVIDRRDPVLLLRRTPPVAHFGHKPTKAEVEKRGTRADTYFDENRYPRVVPEGEASHESSYTAGGSTVSGAAEGIDPRWVDENAKQRRLRDLKGADEGRQVAAKVRDVAGKARARGVDPTPVLDRIRLELDGLMARTDEAA